MAVTEDDFSFFFIDAQVVSVCSEQDANLISFLVKQQFGFTADWLWKEFESIFCFKKGIKKHPIWFARLFRIDTCIIE